MRIGIDISQLAYPNTGVANYLSNLVREFVKNDKHEFVLFFSSLRRELPQDIENELISHPNVRIKKFKLPSSALDMLWNSAHVVPIEIFIGKVDLFISSDWLEPPTKAKKATIIYDMIVYKHPEETANSIVETQKRKLKWVKKETDKVFCISESSRKDAIDILGLNPEKVSVIYPGL